MGGSASSQSVTDASTDISNIVVNSSADCIVNGSGKNTIILTGADNTISGVDQTVSITINPALSTKNGEPGTCQLNANFQSSLSAAVNQQQTSAANTSSNNVSQFLDWNATMQSEAITDKIISNYTVNNTLKCLTQLNGDNIVIVGGTGNDVNDVQQQVAEQVSMTCVENTPSTIGTAFNTTTTANQSNTYSASVIGNLADLCSAIFTKYTMIAVTAFICLIALVVLVQPRGMLGGPSPAPAPTAWVPMSAPAPSSYYPTAAV